MTVRAFGILLVTLAVRRPTVEVRFSNHDAPGVFEVLGDDGGVLLSEYVVGEWTAKVPAAQRYRLRLSRDDGGVLSTRVDPADRVFLMEAKADDRYLEVETFEPATEVTLEVTRRKNVAPFYRLKNRSAEAWFVSPIVQVDGLDTKQMSQCFSQSDRLLPDASVGLGWLDETCLLGDADRGRALFELRSADSNSLALRQRRYIASYEVRAPNGSERWIPDAGERPWCVCIGTEVGPAHDLLIEDDVAATKYRLRDGGVRVERHDVRVISGDVPQFPLPPGAEGHPEFSEWR